jgi:opacity protein-like surface antigen
MNFDARRIPVTVLSMIVFVPLSFSVSGVVRADSTFDPYYAGGAVGQSSEEIANAAFIPSGYLHAQPVGWKLLIGARPRSYLGGEFELIDFGRGHYGPNGDLFSAGTHDQAAAAFIVGYLPVFNSQFDLFAKIGAAVYRANYRFAGNFSDECIVNTNSGTCTPLSQYPTSGATHATGFAYGAGMQYRIGHITVRAEYEFIASAKASPNQPITTTRSYGLGLASLGVAYGF